MQIKLCRLYRIAENFRGWKFHLFHGPGGMYFLHYTQLLIYRRYHPQTFIWQILKKFNARILAIQFACTDIVRAMRNLISHAIPTLNNTWLGLIPYSLKFSRGKYLRFSQILLKNKFSLSFQPRPASVMN